MLHEFFRGYEKSGSLRAAAALLDFVDRIRKVDFSRRYFSPFWRNERQRVIVAHKISSNVYHELKRKTSSSAAILDMIGWGALFSLFSFFMEIKLFSTRKKLWLCESSRLDGPLVDLLPTSLGELHKNDHHSVSFSNVEKPLAFLKKRMREPVVIPVKSFQWRWCKVSQRTTQPAHAAMRLDCSRNPLVFLLYNKQCWKFYMVQFRSLTLFPSDRKNYSRDRSSFGYDSVIDSNSASNNLHR